MEVYINAVLLSLMVFVTIAIVKQRSLFGVVLLAGTYSFLMASLMVVLDAVDVAMTEAAVGAGISTVVLLATLHLTKTREYPQPRPAYVPFFVTAFTGAALVWGTFTLPPFGEADTPMHENTSPKYLDDAKAHRVAPNVVTAVLADYRGYDTMGETTVIFTAGIGIMMLLRARRRKHVPNKDEERSS